MNRVLVGIGLLAALAARPAWAQTTDDCVPSTLNIPEAKYPCLYPDHRALFRLVAEAHRIRLAHLFDPVLAVHTSLVDPLPHQITAVYEAMLPRQPLRFLLADDPGAGKTIMAGLFIKELIARHLAGATRLPENTLMFCGTLAALGGVRPTGRFEFELEDPVLGRVISHGYSVRTLPILG